MAIRTFADQMTADVAAGLNTKQARKLPQRIWTAAQRRLDLLAAATTLNDLNLPGFVLKPLKYHRVGFYSLRVNDQYRIIFRFEEGQAYDVSIEDFHGD